MIDRHGSCGSSDCDSLRSLHYHDQGPGIYPLLPIPGNACRHETDSTDLRLSTKPLPFYLGATFPAYSKLWVIFQEMILVYYEPNTIPIGQRVPISFTKSIYQKLLCWAADLHDDCIPRRESPHGVITMQYVLSPDICGRWFTYVHAVHYFTASSLIYFDPSLQLRHLNSSEASLRAAPQLLSLQHQSPSSSS